MADSNDSSLNFENGEGSATRVTEFLRAMSPASIYARNDATSSGLTWGYRGGRWNSASINAGTQAIGASTTTYMVVNRSTGAVSFSTATTNWNNSTDYARAYKIVSGASAVTSYEDHRAGPLGTQGGAGGGGGGGASTTQPGEMISGYLPAPTNKTYKLIVKAAHAGTITEATTICESGTCTATWKINTTALGGTANSVSTSEQSQAHSSANAFAAGDDIQLTVSSNASCTGMSFTLKYTRTLA